LLAGCVAQGDYPSLAPREGEELAIDEPVREVPQVPDDPALQVGIALLVGEARQGARSFDALYGEAARAVAGAGAEGSDSWVEAQQAISRLEAARLQTGRAAAELDELDLARADLATSADDQRALQAAIAEVGAIAADQQARIDRLSRR
ncbi:MAG TPA: hypothetical protein VJS15_09970, partial [Allosphingosinicella sp.]|nr:hypothetical protein [Allosphingosinicella sp.]